VRHRFGGTLKDPLLVVSLLAFGLSVHYAPAVQAQQSGARTSLLAREPATARSGLEKARALVARWQPDTELRKIFNSAATAEGTATEDDGWTYVFYSKRLRRSYEVSIFGLMTMGSEGTDADDIAKLGTLPKEFADSNKAVELARNSGFQGRSAIRMALLKRADEPATWEVSSGNPTYLVDAEAGKFLRVKE